MGGRGIDPSVSVGILGLFRPFLFPKGKTDKGVTSRLLLLDSVSEPGNTAVYFHLQIIRMGKAGERDLRAL